MFLSVSSTSGNMTSKLATKFRRGGGDLLRKLHALAEAETELSVHQKRLSEIEAKVKLERPFIEQKLKRCIIKIKDVKNTSCALT